MGLKERVKRMCDSQSRQADELDRQIELEIERLGEEAAREVNNEVLREYQLDEPANQS